jgi:hypothetical protein
MLNKNENTNNYISEVEIEKESKNNWNNATAIEKLTVKPSDVKKAGEHNIKYGKSKYKNSLSKKQIKYVDELLGTKIPKTAEKPHNLYSLDSDIVNGRFSFSEIKYQKLLHDYGLTMKDAEKIIIDFNKSSIVLKEDIIVYKGLSRKNPDIKKINDKKIFISTTLDESVAIGYTRGRGDYMAIKVPKGTRIIYLRKYSEYPNHIEVVIPPEYKLKEIKIGKEITYEIVKR